MEIVLSIFLGIGISAASGFRIFIPFLILSIAAYSGYIEVNEEFSWLAGFPAMVSFLAASVIETAGYFNPWMDNMLDTISTPAAIFSGTVLFLSVINENNYYLKLILALIFGGGVAVNIQFLTVKARSVSSVFKSGMGNKIIAGFELLLSVLISIAAISYPIQTSLFVSILIVILYKILKNAKSRLREKF
ncbi:MAG TPA: DUF4126 domain-containing protein [Ignavibacteria bacterium]|nr:DUF4126 domain-containing protein [Ignavibacteria bacterium]